MENAALLYAIIANAIDGIITIDERGIIESINPSACDLFEYLPDEVIGKNIAVLMPQPDSSLHDHYLQNYHHTGQARMIGIGREVTGAKKDGTLFPFRLGLSEVQYSGRKIYTGFIHDLSKEKQAEQRLKDYASKLEDEVAERTKTLHATVAALEEAKTGLSTLLEKEKELNLLKSRFVSIASHEFRTPLTAITLSASLIERYTVPVNPEGIFKHVEKIFSGVTHLTGILNDFLSLEKLEAGKETAKFSPFNLVVFCEAITENMQSMAKQHQNIIYQHTGTKNQINLDESLLKCCIVNLISNSIKYSGENTFIDFNSEINENGCTITIRDNGIGIPLTDQKHLFEAFFRAHNTGEIPGTGLGLNIVARYIDLMGGTVKFKSEVDQGTIFTILFPLT
jgi:two-component system sensor kinase FixL